MPRRPLWELMGRWGGLLAGRERVVPLHRCLPQPLDRGAWDSRCRSLTASLLAGLQSLREESQVIVQRKPRLPAGRTGWRLIFLDQPKNLRTYPRGPTPPVRACDSLILWPLPVLFYAALLIKKNLSLFVSVLSNAFWCGISPAVSPGEEGKFDPDLSSVSSRSFWTCSSPVSR